MAGAIDYGALALALGGVLTLAIMIWIAFAGDGVASDCCVITLRLDGRTHLGRVLINRDWSVPRVDRCPLFPQKRTCAVQLGMSAKGQ
jgi:hypothetical protein